MAEIRQEIVDGFDHIISERNNTYVSLRKVKWTSSSEPKLDLRNYVTTSDGDEKIMKGICFDDETADELTRVLCETGYGQTKQVCKALSDREDFIPSVLSSLSEGDLEKLKTRCINNDFELETDNEETDDEEIYDIRNELMLE